MTKMYYRDLDRITLPLDLTQDEKYQMSEIAKQLLKLADVYGHDYYPEMRIALMAKHFRKELIDDFGSALDECILHEREAPMAGEIEAYLNQVKVSRI